MSKDTSLKFARPEVLIWDLPESFRDALRATFIDTPFEVFVSGGPQNFSAGFRFFGVGLNIGINTPGYGYIKVEGFGFDIDFAAGLYRDHTPKDAYDIEFAGILTGLTDTALDDAETACEKMMKPLVAKEVPNPCGPCSGCTGACADGPHPESPD